MKFLFDHNQEPKLARAINELLKSDGHSAVPLRDKFLHSTPDIDWMHELAKDGGWSVISGDTRIAKNKHERAAWLESNLSIFFLKPGWQKMPFWEKSSRLIWWMPHIIDQADRIEGSAGFWVPIGTRSKPRFEQVMLK